MIRRGIGVGAWLNGGRIEGIQVDVREVARPHIVALLEKKKGDLDGDDVKQMKRVAGYVHRHLAQKPGQDVEHSRWRYSLMNWGHDPLKK